MEINSTVAPKLEVIGVYRPAADRSYLEGLVSQCLAPYQHLDKIRVSEIELAYREALEEVALIEVDVCCPDASFSIADFAQPDPEKERGYWKVAWDEVFLAPDDETRIDCPSFETPSLSRYRVLFWLHQWRPQLGLLSTYGEMPLPSAQAIPARLWKHIDFYVIV